MNRIYHPEDLNTRTVYRIGSGFYQYTGQCPHARVDHPKWTFEPLPNQRAKAFKKLNFRQVCSQVYETNETIPIQLNLL